MTGGVPHVGWAVVLILILVASGLGAFALPTKQRAAPPVGLWDVPRVAQTFTSIGGALAGFSVASTIFISNLTVTRHAPEFPSLIGMFVIAFMVFVGAAQEFATTPNLPDRTDQDYEQLQRFAYLVALFGYFIALAVSWNALRLLLLALELDPLADVVSWMLLFAVAAGTIRLALQQLYMLTTLTRRTCLAIPTIGWAMALVFRLILVPFVPGLTAPPNEPFLVAVGCFGVAALGFGVQATILSLHDSAAFRVVLQRAGERVVMGLLAMVSTIAAVLWIVVALG